MSVSAASSQTSQESFTIHVTNPFGGWETVILTMPPTDTIEKLLTLWAERIGKSDPLKFDGVDVLFNASNEGISSLKQKVQPVRCLRDFDVQESDEFLKLPVATFVPSRSLTWIRYPVWPYKKEK